MSYYYVLVIFACVASTNAQDGSPCSKQMELEKQCFMVVKTSPEARMLMDRKKQAAQACLPDDYPQECFARWEAMHDCFETISKKADSDPEFKQARDESMPTVDDCFGAFAPDVHEGFEEILSMGGRRKPHHCGGKIWHHRKGKGHHHHHGGASSEQSKSNETSAEADRSHEKSRAKNDEDASSAGSSRSMEGRRGRKWRSHSDSGEQTESQRGGKTDSGSASKERQRWRSHSDSGEQTESQRGGKADSGSASKERQRSKRDADRGSASQQKAPRSGTSDARSASKEKPIPGAGPSAAGSASKEAKNSTAGASGGSRSKERTHESGSKHHGHKDKCHKTKSQQRCIADQLQMSSKDTVLIDVMNLLISQKRKCMNLVQWSCSPRTPQQHKCLWEARKPLQELFRERMTSCLQAKGFPDAGRFFGRHHHKDHDHGHKHGHHHGRHNDQADTVNGGPQNMIPFP